MTRALSGVAVVCALALSSVAANATPRHHGHQHHRNVRLTPPELNGCVFTNEGRQICGGPIQRNAGTVRASAGDGGRGVIGGRPAGCPHRFCGCEASIYVFGEIRPELNLASNWLRKFPRATPAPGMAAARSGHVMVLISHVGGNDWLVHDGNSGGGKTREHVRSIASYGIVDPRARLASQ